ncbi:MAG: bile acid:sodium symporter family protein [Haloarculaceae archaeon]
MPSAETSLRRAAAVVDDYLLVWILLAVSLGVAFPSLSLLSPLSTPVLAVMVAGVSLTLTPARFRAVRPASLATILLVQSTMALLAFALATAAGLSPPLTAGFVVVGAVTPELVTPVMTELADGDTALATAALVCVGLGSVAFVPAVVAWLLGDVAVDPFAVLSELAVAVVVPMSVAVGVRTRWPDRVGRYDDLYPSVSALMVVLVVGVAAASNARFVTDRPSLLVPVAAVAVALNGGGYALGWLAGVRMDCDERIAATLSVGMRDFAVAAALVLAAGFPTAGLAAVVFGVVEMVSSAALAQYFRST